MIAPARRHVPRELAGIFAALAADLKELRWWGRGVPPGEVARVRLPALPRLESGLGA